MVKRKNTVLKLRAQGARNGIEILTVGAVGLIFIMLFNLLRPDEISIFETFLVSLCLAAIFVGFLKTQEPYYSLVITEQELTYQHKYGYWSLKQENLNRSGIPKVEQELEPLELNAVGIKLNDTDEFLLQLAPRIAGKLLIEQRHLFMQVIQKHCKNGNCPSEWLVEDNHYTSVNGRSFNGLIAMFANRMRHLRQLTGYDLLLPASVLDRSIWDFSHSLNAWRNNPVVFIESQLERQTPENRR
ncbi:DUF2982 domain-containing protein [Pseudoalteromonas sp. SR44-5]|uniref:DUF2982 domain-containing protein n=1 Tax=Pseudoalteromonas TaxID=53246 RepID=UPI0012307F5D|nr:MULTISPECIES: DUF2982 domain-containing protein [Pseudoalteromonas]MBB1341805.1 DUF2982 domain-containing protein [Pseudoalteromonas sp. SR45-6]MBB1367013.1 DUF2982 domain-containing protein [Pseudoalteromonas sp. SR44-5]MBB1418150.1 DUF2982 domain-containing protein [Pseudoalteromonas sp. SG44-1]MBB1422548.1 DUF2982 domain-containing protein [Pseudoalteromonas sp. SG43-7]MBB1435188.1 DUF2982 domain-containing protein [Pseudoalteromonas sp. SG43-6]